MRQLGGSRTRTMTKHLIFLTIGMAVGSAAARAQALDETAAERDNLKACEKRICEMLVKKQTSGTDFACALSKTWSKDKIKEGIEKKKMSWSLGNARCTVDVAAKREMIVGAVSKPEHTVDFAPQTVKCQVEREAEITNVSVTVAPRISFKDGKAQKAWINVKDIEAPAIIKGALWTVAQVEANLGLFHGDMISAINEFIDSKCPKALAAE